MLTTEKPRLYATAIAAFVRTKGTQPVVTQFAGKFTTQPCFRWVCLGEDYHSNASRARKKTQVNFSKAKSVASLSHDLAV